MSGNDAEADRLTTAVRAFCTEAGLHLRCSFPSCGCKNMGKPMLAAIAALNVPKGYDRNYRQEAEAAMELARVREKERDQAEANNTALEAKIYRLDTSLKTSESLKSGYLDQLSALEARIKELGTLLTDAPILSKYHSEHGFEREWFITDYEAWKIRVRRARSALGDQHE